MSYRINDCLAGKEPNYLYPFLILRDTSHEDIREEIEAIYESGCGGFLVECRGHTDWGGERWWSDFGFILEEARKRNMKVWLTDDVTVPSGKANWAIRDKHPELHRKSVVLHTVDTVGPANGVAFLLEPILGEGESVLAAIAYRVDGTDASPVYSDPREITENIEDGILFWDAPEGFWRIFVVIRTEKRGFAAFLDQVDLLNPASCELMIEEVYEPHYQHFKEYFGNTLEAFFTDEPMFANMAQPRYDYCEKLGREDGVLPWREDMISVLAREEGWTEAEMRLLLPALWKDIGGKTPVVRRRYMDFVTRQYSKNFVQRLGDWCLEHGVLYTGHILEDMNAHMRLGCSTGHFFRSQKGQHTAGFDLVLQQVKVGNRRISHVCDNSAKYSDPAFYLYTLGRMGASIGHLYPEMQGRVMCENAGAGGWSEGLSTRKYMLDAMMVSGGNIVVPAVFDPLRNNNHIPPFAYDHGENPQYPFMKPLMQYVNRLCHMTNGGTHRANALIYYPAEGDWSGNIRAPQETVAPLALSHIDYDFASWDLLKDEATSLDAGKLRIHKECFDALVVPCCDYLPGEILDRFEEIAKAAPVIFADCYPTVAETGERFVSENAILLPAEEIPAWFKKQGFVDFLVDGCEDLMHLHLFEEGRESYLFFNLSASAAIDSEICFPYRGVYTVYDAWSNSCEQGYTEDGNVRLYIPPRSTLMVIFGELDLPDGVRHLRIPSDAVDWKPIASDTVFSLSMRYANETEWKEQPTLTAGELKNLAPRNSRFTGTLKYRAVISASEKVEYVDLGEVGEVAELFVNGISCGMLVGAPFRFSVKDAWKEGMNVLEVVVASNCAYRRRDKMSCLLPLPPTGLLGPVRLA